MANIRVYEAARKLNIETSALMKILEERNTPVKSPIAFISQSDFDDILNTLTSAPEHTSAATTPLSGEEEEENVTAPQAPSGEGKVISIASAGEEGQKEQPARVIPFARFAAEEEEERKEKEQTRPEPAPTPASSESAKPSAGQAILSFLALGLASAAMLFALTVNSGVTKNTAGIEKAMEASSALRGDMAALKDSVQVNKSMIGDNSAAIAETRGRIEAVNRTQARDDLLKRSDALEELSATAPEEMAVRLKNVSDSLRQLASSL